METTACHGVCVGVLSFHRVGPGLRTEVIRVSSKCLSPGQLTEPHQTIILTPKGNGLQAHFTEILTGLLHQNHTTGKNLSNWVFALQVQSSSLGPASSLGPPALWENTRLLLEEGELDSTAVAPVLHSGSGSRKIRRLASHRLSVGLSDP